MPNLPEIKTVSDGVRWMNARRQASAEGAGIDRALELFQGSAASAVTPPAVMVIAPTKKSKRKV